MFWGKLYFSKISVTLSHIPHFFLFLQFYFEPPIKRWGWCSLPLKLVGFCDFQPMESCVDGALWFLKLHHKRRCSFLFASWDAVLVCEACSPHVSSPAAWGHRVVRRDHMEQLWEDWERCPANPLPSRTPAAPTPATIWLQPNEKPWARTAQPGLPEFPTQKPW